MNLRNLSRELYAFEHPDSNPEAAPLYSDFYAAFEAIAEGDDAVQLVSFADMVD